MAPLILRRLGLGVLTLLLVAVVVFSATQVLPGDVATAILGRNATPLKLAQLRAQLHLDRPVLTQFWLWSSGIVRGNAGVSLANNLPVSQNILPRLENSAVLVLLTAGISLPLSAAAGVFAAVRKDATADVVLIIFALALAAMPEFVIAISVIIVFAVSVFQWLPPVSLIPPGTSVFSEPRILVLPALTLMIAVFPYVFRMMRSAMIDVLESEYIEMARLKGISPWRLLLVHALPAALPPAIQAAALTLAYLAGGIVIVEYVFGFEGFGQGLVQAIVARDVPMIQAMTLLLAAFYVAVNILADILTILLTPKLRK